MPSWAARLSTSLPGSGRRARQREFSPCSAGVEENTILCKYPEKRTMVLFLHSLLHIHIGYLNFYRKNSMLRYTYSDLKS